MRFSERLETLMSIYRLNNITLARGIGADASLVSRWRTGDRIPKRNSAAYADVAAFLAGRGMLQHDRATLSSMLGIDCEKRDATQSALLAWLQGKAVIQPLNLAPEEPELVSDIFEHLSNAFTDAARAPSGPVSLYPRVQNGMFADHERFDGVSGLRQAVINFFHSAILCKIPGDVYLMPPADNGWISGDPAFERLYTDSLRAIIQSGHTVHMLHPAAYGSSLAPLLSTYMPLYTTGRFFSYGRSAVTAAAPSIFVLPGHAAVVSYGTSGEANTLYFKNQKDIVPFAHMVHSQLADSNPLAAACPRESPLALAERLIQLEDRPGALFGVRNTLDPIFLPEKMLYSILSEQLTADKTAAHLDMLARRRETLMRQLDDQPWVLILPYSVIDAIQINGSCRLSGVELLTPRDVTLSGETLSDYLRALLGALDSFPLLRISFIDDCPPINLTVKENAGTVFMADSVESQPSAVYVGDLTLCETLVRWFTARDRDLSDSGRRKTIEQINETLDYLI